MKYANTIHTVLILEIMFLHSLLLEKEEVWDQRVKKIPADLEADIFFSDLTSITTPK